MERLCDLHTHSYYSDGTLSPKELIRAAEKAGLSAIALCDHNTVDGLREFLDAARGHEIIAIPGAEITTEHEGTELHLLALFLPENSFEKLENYLDAMNERKNKAYVLLEKRLCEAGYRVDLTAIMASTPNGHINRAHFAAELYKNGYVGSIKEAFDGILSEEAGFYRPAERLQTLDAIRFVTSLGALPVLAHPFLNLTENDLRHFLSLAVPAGLIGMETRYSAYDEKTAALASEIAREFSILESGGSDFHGTNKPDISLGSGKGTLMVPFSFSEALRKTCV